MSRNIYSAVILEANAISGEYEIAADPVNTIVLRDATMTYGSYIGFVSGGVALSIDGPWSWIFSTATADLINVHQRSLEWHGRIVIPAGSEWYIQVQNPDTADFTFWGYKLTP